MASGTRQRILTAAMRLFGEQGFTGTSIAQIEEAAGLRPGAGGLYRHFASKDALLAAGVRERIEARNDLLPTMTPTPGAEPQQLLAAVARAGIRRLDDERDLNRILVRDLASSPELLAFMRDAELRTDHAALVTLLTTLGGPALDAEALAAILIDAVTNYWMLTDIFGGTHPLGIDQERYLNALAAFAVASIGGTT